MKHQLLRTYRLKKKSGEFNLLDRVDIDLYKGEILGVIGLCNSGHDELPLILCGKTAPDAGEILIDESPVRFSSHTQAQMAGVFYIGATPDIVPEMTVSENIFVMKKARLLLWDKKRNAVLADELLDSFGLNISHGAKAGALTLLEQHLVQLLRFLSQNAKLIIIDKISDLYSDNERRLFLRALERIKAKGVSVILLDNRLDTVKTACDGIVVIRNGQKVAHLLRGDYAKTDLVALMRGDFKSSAPIARKGKPPTGSAALEAFEVDFHDCIASFAINSGELVGFSGDEVNSTVSIMNAIIGLRGPKSGALRLLGQEVSFKSVKDAVGRGVGFVPPEGANGVLFKGLSVSENINFFDYPRLLNSLGFVNRRLLAYATQTMLKKLELPESLYKSSVSDITSQVDTEKIMLAKFLLMPPKVLVLLEPNLRTDVNMTIERYNNFRRIAQTGAGIAVFSANRAELIDYCDRVYAFNKDGELLETTA